MLWGKKTKHIDQHIRSRQTNNEKYSAQFRIAEGWGANGREQIHVQSGGRQWGLVADNMKDKRENYKRKERENIEILGLPNSIPSLLGEKSRTSGP